MIVADRKEMAEIAAMVAPFKRVLVCACETCVTVCQAGGRKEAEALQGLLAAEAGHKGLARELRLMTMERQCENEYADQAAENAAWADAILSTACGAGVQTLARRYPDKVVLPALNTTFYGEQTAPGAWAEVCAGCGNCMLARTGGICPMARCSKRLHNGPCGGSAKGKCEVDQVNTECAWQLIHDRLKAQGRLDLILGIEPIRDWRSSASGGVRRRVAAEGALGDD
jgi:hypothetical protein